LKATQIFCLHRQNSREEEQYEARHRLVPGFAHALLAGLPAAFILSRFTQSSVDGFGRWVLPLKQNLHWEPLKYFFSL